jgi:hypothetical protein
MTSQHNDTHTYTHTNTVIHTNTVTHTHTHTHTHTLSRTLTFTHTHTIKHVPGFMFNQTMKRKGKREYKIWMLKKTETQTDAISQCVVAAHHSISPASDCQDFTCLRCEVLSNTPHSLTHDHVCHSNWTGADIDNLCLATYA